MPIIQSAIGKEVRGSLEFKKNRDNLESLVRQTQDLEAVLRQGGGDKAIAEAAREGTDDRAGSASQPSWTRGCLFRNWVSSPPTECTRSGAAPPSAGSSPGRGAICGRDFMIIANDATVKAGAFFPMTAKKVIRAQTDRPGKPPARSLPRRLGGRLPASPGRSLPGPGRFRPRLLPQRAPVGPWRAADRRHHGHLRGGRRLPARDVRHASDDRRVRALPRRSRPREGGHRAEHLLGGSGWRRDPLGHFGDRGLPREGRRESASPASAKWSPGMGFHDRAPYSRIASAEPAVRR